MTLYIATDLTQREIDLADIAPLADQPDLRINGQLYRALTPEYYAYLRQQMQRLKQAVDAGQCDQHTYRPLANRFNALHAIAVSLFGEEALRAALRSSNPQSYRVPGDGADVIEVQPAPHRAWNGQGTLAGFETNSAGTPAAALTGPVQIGQRVRTFGTTVTITGYHAPDEDFPGGWIEVVTEAGVTGSADLRFVQNRQGQALVPITRTPEEQRIAALPDEPFDFTDADLDASALPEPHYYPAGDDAALRFFQPVSPRAVEAVDAIRAHALALGWTEPMLYQNRSRFAFPCGQDYGLVCFLGGGKVVGEITANSMAIRAARAGGATLTITRPHAGEKESPPCHARTMPKH